MAKANLQMLAAVAGGDQLPPRPASTKRPVTRRAWLTFAQSSVMRGGACSCGCLPQRGPFHSGTGRSSSRSFLTASAPSSPSHYTALCEVSSHAPRQSGCSFPAVRFKNNKLRAPLRLTGSGLPPASVCTAERFRPRPPVPPAVATCKELSSSSPTLHPCGLAA
jgi:hypothetical protein